jgi:hypothetical protein
VCDWIEEFLCHGPGDIQGEPLVLDEEFRAFIWRAYELYPKGHPLEGRRVYRRAVLSRPKGRAKSELAGALAVCEALGPVRFDGWDADGDPVGAPVQAAVVRCFATAEDQAGNTFDNALYMCENGAIWDEFEIDTGEKKITIGDWSTIVSTTSAATSKDGGKDTFDVFDETHLWTLPRLKQLHGTVTRNLLKRMKADGWCLETTTMFCPGEESVAEETFNAIEKAGGRLSGMLFDHRQAPDDLNVKDDEQLAAGLRYVYGAAASWTNIQGIIDDQFRNPTKREAEARRYFLNQPWSVAERFVLPSQWDAICEEGVEIPDRAEVVLAFDGSFNNDCTGIVAASIEETPILQVVELWERPPDLPLAVDYVVPRLEVMAALRAACKKWRVREIAADSYNWVHELQELAEEGLPAVEYSQQSAKMIPATKRLYDCITNVPETDEDGKHSVQKVRHNGDLRLRRHVLAATVKRDSRGVRVQKDPAHPMIKIDLCVCAIMAADRAWSAIDETPHVWSIAEEIEKLEAAARARGEVPEEDEIVHPGADRFIRIS